MENLIQNLQRTIRALEALAEKEVPQAQQLDEFLDQLFQQKIDLMNLSTSTSSQAYQQAAQAFGQVAARAEKTVKDPAQLRSMIPQLADAINKLTKLLNNHVI